jgi:hypothetical protein
MELMPQGHVLRWTHSAPPKRVDSALCHPALASQYGAVTIASYGSQIKLRLFKIAQIGIFENVQTESQESKWPS